MQCIGMFKGSYMHMECETVLSVEGQYASMTEYTVCRKKK